MKELIKPNQILNEEKVVQTFCENDCNGCTNLFCNKNCGGTGTVNNSSSDDIDILF